MRGKGKGGGNGGKGGKGSGKGGKNNPTGKDNPKGGKTNGGKGQSTESPAAGSTEVPPVPTPPPLDPKALTDARGRRPCYNFVQGKCKNPNCKRYHGPLTKAMKTKMAEDLEKMAAKKVAGGDGTQSEIENNKPKAKATAKAKGQATKP